MKHTVLCTLSRASPREMPVSEAWTAPRVWDLQRGLLSVGAEKGLMVFSSLNRLDLQDSSVSRNLRVPDRMGHREEGVELVRGQPLTPTPARAPRLYLVSD